MMKRRKVQSTFVPKVQLSSRGVSYFDLNFAKLILQPKFGNVFNLQRSFLTINEVLRNYVALHKKFDQRSQLKCPLFLEVVPSLLS